MRWDSGKTLIAFGYVTLTTEIRQKEIKRSIPNHTQVERYDRLTTKICQFCVVKINEFVLFRKICASTNVRLRTELSNVLDDEASVDIIAVAAAGITNDNASIGDLTLNDGATAVTIATGAGM